MVSFPSKLPVWGSRRGSLLFLPTISLTLLCFSFVVYACLSPDRTPTSSVEITEQRRRGFLSSVSSFSSHLNHHRLRCYSGPARLSAPLHLPSSQSIPCLFRFVCSSLPGPCCGSKRPTCHTWSTCRWSQPGTEAGASQQPRCICNTLPLWYPCYVMWSGWAPASWWNKVVSAPEKLPSRSFWACDFKW